MKLAIFNGSPRQKKSNSTLLIQKFIEGYNDNITDNIDIHYLANISKMSENVEAFREADNVIIIFPLYTDAMPGQVKLFFENIINIDSEGKKVGFIVQSGFPESYHSSFVERYLIKLSEKMKWNFLGVLIKGGVEGIQIMPPSWTKKLYKDFNELGRYYASTGKFKAEIVRKLRTPYKLGKFRLFYFKAGDALGLTNFYWDKNLKENKAFEKRFDRPYI